LVQVKNKCERSLAVRPPGVEKTSRLRSRDLVASGVKCGPHDGKNSKMKSWTVSASKPRSSRDYVGAESLVVIGGGYTEFAGFPVVHQKTTRFLVDPQSQDRRTEEPKMEVQQHQTDLTGVRRRSLETLKQRTRVGIARLASRLSKFAVAGHPSDGAMTKIPEFALEGH
jgi:hypothetical protein